MTMEPRASRPYMPGYGIETSAGGMLTWSWATERLTSSRDYWVATVDADGKPAVMPVWGAWFDEAVWFSSSHASRRARNLARDARCTVTTSNALEPVVVEGTAVLVPGHDAAQRFADITNVKYSTDYRADFFAENALFRVTPVVAYGLAEAQFASSPTKWTFR